jgi:tetratricopeptide (TPR) repeat protein
MLSLLLLVLIVILAPLYPYIITYTIAVKHTFRPMKLEPADSGQMPSEIRDLMQPWIHRLSIHDFAIVSYSRIHVGLISEEPQWVITLQHSSQQIFAGLMVKPKPDARYPVLCVFSSYWQETNLITLNAKDFSTYSKTHLERSNYLDKVSADELWLGHQSFLRSICSIESLEKMTVEEWENRLEINSRKITDLHVKKGEAFWTNKEEETFKKNPWLVFKMIVKIGIDRVKNNRSSIQQDGNSEIDINKGELELETRAFLDRPKKAGLGMSSNQRIGLLAGSFLIFICIYATQFQPVKLLIFILVLVFHELGHISAMTAFGYRDTTMLFIPWLGALATGKKENASLSEKVWISLAGPLPGLILGIAIAVSFPNDYSWLKDASIMLIVLNLFNLLPIYPLDGGQVVDLLIFSRRPYLGVIFKSIGVLLLGTIGLIQPLMMIFAALIALSIPHSFRLAKLRSDFKQDFPDLISEDRENLVRTIFQYLSNPKHRYLSPPLKTWLVDSLLDNQQQDRSKRSIRWGLFIFYMMSLIGSFVGGLYAVIPSFGAILNIPYAFSDRNGYALKYYQQQIARANRQLQKNPQDASAYLKRGIGYYGLREYSVALKDVDRVISLDPNNYDAYQIRSRIRQLMGDASGAKTDEQHSRQLMWTVQVKQFDRIIEQQPNDAPAYIQRANAKRMLNDKQGATSDYNMALKLTPNSTEALLGRADLEMKANNYKQALLDVNRTLELDNKNAHAYALRSSLYKRTGDFKRAEIDRNKAESIAEQ